MIKPINNKLKIKVYADDEVKAIENMYQDEDSKEFMKRLNNLSEFIEYAENFNEFDYFEVIEVNNKKYITLDSLYNVYGTEYKDVINILHTKITNDDTEAEIINGVKLKVVHGNSIVHLGQILIDSRISMQIAYSMRNILNHDDLADHYTWLISEVFTKEI